MPEAVTLPVPPIMAAFVRVMAPEVVEAEAPLFIKDPLIVKGTAVVNPFKSTLELLPMVVPGVVPKASLLPKIKRPLAMFVIPLKVFTPLNVQVPTPALVNVPVPLMIPEAVAAPAPLNIAAPDRLMAPDAVAWVTLLFSRDPLIVKGSAVVYPFKSTIAFKAMVVAADTLPKAALLPIVIVPALTVVAPVYKFTPDKVSAPVPFLIKISWPLPSLMTPEKVVLPLLPPTVKVILPATELVMVPAPAIEPTTRLFPLRSNVPVTVTALLATGPKGVVADAIFIVPSVMVVAPV